jgi:hypothetical protein
MESTDLVAHSPNANKESTLSRQHILDKIAALQSSHPQVRYTDRDFVYRDFSLLQKYSLNNLLSWYRMATRIVQTEKRKRPPLMDIRECFRRVHDPDNPAPISTTTSITNDNDHHSDSSSDMNLTHTPSL